MQFNDIGRRDARGLMKVVDILGNHGWDFAGTVQARERPMTAPWLGCAKLLLQGKAPAPGLVAHVLAGDKFVKWNRLIFGPKPSGRTEIGNPAFGRYPRAGKWHDRLSFIDEPAQLGDRGRKIGGNHCCMVVTARSSVSEVYPMRYLHTMLRVRDLDAALDFYCNKLGLKETRRRVDEKNRYTLVFLAAPGDEKLIEAGKKTGRPGLEVELTYNWDTEDYGEARHFGHLAYEVDDIYATCDRLMKAGVTINRPPRDGVMAFVRSPDRHSIELLQKGSPLPPQEPWKSMGNTGKW